MAKRSPLVAEYLEGVSGEVLTKHPGIIAAYVRGRHGIYALYRGERLYYVGLAKSLGGRLKTHLRDRHKGKWTNFSVYLTSDDRHMPELEALLLRVVPTHGNKQRGRLGGAVSILPRLKEDMKERQRLELDHWLGQSSERQAARTPG